MQLSHVDMQAVRAEVAAGYLTMRPHNDACLDLWILNYTQAAQWERHWTPLTLACRGLIVDSAGKIQARPFPKFFNWGEPGAPEAAEYLGMQFQAWEKMDGSLGILYWTGDTRAAIATRGSFHSDQAEHATALLNVRYAPELRRMDRDLTYLFEIVYPENRIVVNYDDRDELVLLAVIETATGRDIPLDRFSHLAFRQPELLRFDRPEAALELDRENFEGVVIRYEDGTRVKVKLEAYKRLHAVVTNLSDKQVWATLSAGHDIGWLMRSGAEDGVESLQFPDELFEKMREMFDQLQGRFDAVWEAHHAAYLEIIVRRLNWQVEPRKLIAGDIMARAERDSLNPSVLFGLLDGQDVRSRIWTMLRP